MAAERLMAVGERVPIAVIPSILALDGEREIEVRRGMSAEISLELDGPRVVDVSRTLHCAMEKGIFLGEIR